MPKTVNTKGWGFPNNYIPEKESRTQKQEYKNIQHTAMKIHIWHHKKSPRIHEAGKYSF